MVCHALTGNIFAMGSTRSTFNTLYCRIGDIVPAKWSVELWESWRDNRTDLLRPVFCVRRVGRGIDRSGQWARISLCMLAKRSVQ